MQTQIEKLSPVELVKAADTVLLPKNKNENNAAQWLRDNSFDVPDFRGRSLHCQE